MSILQELTGVISKDTSKSFIDYCKNIILDNGTVYDPYGRSFMHDIVKDYYTHPHITIEKGAQTGFSTLAIAHALHLADAYRRNVIYYLPTDVMAKTFGPTRFDPYIERSTYFKDKLTGTDQAGLKQINTHFVYIKGLVSKTGAISIPADVIMFDEVALIDPENMELAQDRITASDLAWQRYFSVALFPADGIDELFEYSDMRKYLVKCLGCRRESPLEDDFPENFEEVDGKVKMVCPKCGKEINVQNGRWVAEKPDVIDRRGYRVPQLIVPGLKLDLLWTRWKKVRDKPSKRAIFNRSVLSKPDSGNLQPVSPEVLERIEQISDYYFQDSSDEITGIGIDMGDKAHIAIVAPYQGEGIRPIAFFELEVEELVEFVQELEKRYNCGALVIDAMPYKTESKKVVRSLAKAPGYIQYFKGNELREGTEGEDDKQVKKVTVDRDDSLDETTDLFATQPPLALLPKPRTSDEEKTIKTVRTHLLKLVKEKSGEDSGNVVIRYKKNTENHYGMALNSARIALYLAIGRRQQLGPVEYTTIERRAARFAKGGY